MMKKLCMLLGCAVLLCGCTKSNIVRGQSAGPDFNVPENVEIVWEQVSDEMVDNFVNSEEYSVGDGIAFRVEEDKKQFDLNIISEEDADRAELADYIDAVIKGFNDEIASQNSNYELSGVQSYGGFFQEYAIQLNIIPYETAEDESTAFFTKLIPADSAYEKIVIE